MAKVQPSGGPRTRGGNDGGIVPSPPSVPVCRPQSLCQRLLRWFVERCVNLRNHDIDRNRVLWHRPDVHRGVLRPCNRACSCIKCHQHVNFRASQNEWRSVVVVAYDDETQLFELLVTRGLHKGQRLKSVDAAKLRSIEQPSCMLFASATITFAMMLLCVVTAWLPVVCQSESDALFSFSEVNEEIEPSLPHFPRACTRAHCSGDCIHICHHAI